jgi:hypothetical protein
MIQLLLNTVTAASPLILGPAAYFKIDGLLLQQGPHDEIVGRYRDHHWEVAGRYVSSYACTGRVYVHFEDQAANLSTIFGPFAQLRFPNGCCYADQVLFAELIEATEHWLHRADGASWPVILIT